VTLLKCDGLVSDDFNANLLLNLSVKKIVKICQNLAKLLTR